MTKRIILEILKILIAIIWSVIGAIFWIPFLIRMITIFVISVLLSVTNGNSMGSAEHGLDAGVTFYINGFTKIFDSINNIINDNPSKPNTKLTDNNSLQTILIHLAYTFIFWLSTVAFIGYLLVDKQSTTNTQHIKTNTTKIKNNITTN
ncbi:hypothetical protein [Sulfurimonas sp.]